MDADEMVAIERPDYVRIMAKRNDRKARCACDRTASIQDVIGHALQQLGDYLQ